MVDNDLTVDVREFKIHKEKVASYIKVSKEFLQQGLDADDFIYNQLTFQLYGFVHSCAKDKGELIKYITIERPTFWDWLFRRSKTIKVSINYELSHLIKPIDVPPGGTLVILKQTE